MRSREQYIITKDQVHDYANDWLSTCVRLESWWKIRENTGIVG